MKVQEKRRRLARRKKRVRAKIRGTKTIPRLSVYRSLSHIYAQIIDDQKGATLVSADDQEIVPQKTRKTEKGKVKRSKREEIAFRVGELIAQKAKREKIKKVVFDRGGRAYHGQVKALAEGAREGSLQF